MASASTVRRLFLGLTVAILEMGCASTPGGGPAPGGDPTIGAGSDVITTKELRRLDLDLSLMEAIEHARPWFLHPRGSVSTVSIDGLLPTESSVLRTMLVANVREVRLVHGGPAAILPDGTAAVGDVILVVTGRD